MSNSSVGEGFRKFLRLNKSDRKIIQEEIKNAKIGKLPEDLAQSISDKTSISFEDNYSILSSFASTFLTSELVEEKRFTEILIELKEDLKSKDIVNYINEFLKQSKNFTTSIKATNLAYNRGRIIRNTRIITDIRPIFTTSPKDDLIGSIIVHNLKIEFMENDERKEYYFAIDSTDLKQIELQVRRARNKEDKLKKFISDSRLDLIELK